MMQFRGIPVSDGIAIGPALLYLPQPLEIPEGQLAEGQARLDAWQQFLSAREKADGQLRELAQSLGETAEAGIFSAHREMLFDDAIADEVQTQIAEGSTPAAAVEAVCDQFAQLLEGMEDPLFAARGADVRDIKKRLLHILLNAEMHDLSHLTEPVIVVANDLLPSDTAGLDRERVLGIVTEKGGETSHSAIIARKLGIPALAGVKGATERIRPQQQLILDAVTGTLFADAAPELFQTYRAQQAQWRAAAEETERYLDAPPVMADGSRVQICLNIGSAADEDLAPARFCDGVGLFRSEFFYMNSPVLPDEETQYRAYRKTLEAFAGKEVILRTLDIGGDKKVACLDLPTEDNPFLGLRAVRYCFAHEEILQTQLRAALRASVHGDLAIMFPMISSLDEIRRAKALLASARRALEADGQQAGDPKLGIMIEIPSIAIMADQVVFEVDFASIGTNDLTQYLLAVDRLNPDLGDYYQKYHPAVFRLIRQIALAFTAAGKPLSVCGELGGDPLAAPALVGMGIHKLSMSISAVARVKRALSTLTPAQCTALSSKICTLSTAAETEACLRQILKP